MWRQGPRRPLPASTRRSVRGFHRTRTEPRGRGHEDDLGEETNVDLAGCPARPGVAGGLGGPRRTQHLSAHRSTEEVATAEVTPRRVGEGGRPPRNRGGGSGAAVRIGTSRAPGGLGRATVRSVRRSRAGGSGCVREGTTRSKLGRPRPDVTHSPLWAGCISHLGRTYDRGWAEDRPQGRMSSTSHTFFTPSAARRPGRGTRAAHLPRCRLRCA